MNTARNHYEVETTVTKPSIIKPDNLKEGDLIYANFKEKTTTNFNGKDIVGFIFQLLEDFPYEDSKLPAGSLFQVGGAVFNTCYEEGGLLPNAAYALHFIGKIKLKDGKPFTRWTIQKLKVTPATPPVQETIEHDEDVDGFEME